jgi:formylglycine-generating enzyme required for sulfatase activity
MHSSHFRRRWLQFASFAALVGSVACDDDAASPKNVTAAFAGVKAGQVRDDNGLGMKLAWSPPLEFTMGSPASETGRGDDENQVHVTLTNGFWMGQHEVTQGQWQRVMRSVPWKAMKAALSSGLDYVKEGDAYPAIGVSWQDAMMFCEKLTQQERRTGRLSAGWQYTLPTEAQWESACRAGTKTRYSFGDDESQLNDYAWWGILFGNANAKREEYAHAVGVKKANPWGLCDMHGNVYEWCRDWYVKQLPGGTDPQGPSKGKGRVIRGGSWVDPSNFCRSADRSRGKPDYRSTDLGFRVVAVPTGK